MLKVSALLKTVFFMCIFSGGICNAGEKSTELLNGKNKMSESTVEINDPLKLVTFGASTAAYRGKLFIASRQLSERLSENGIENCFFNSGVPGNTTEMGIQRLVNDVLDYHPDIVLISFVTNDATIDVWQDKTEPRVSLDKYVENLKYFIKELKARNILVIFYSNPPLYMTEELKKLYGKEPYLSKGFNFMLDQYLAKQKETALSSDCYFVDVNKAFRDKAGGVGEELNKYMLDGMHPNEEGQKIVADAIWKLWQEKPEILKHRTSEKIETLKITKPAKNTVSDSEILEFEIYCSHPVNSLKLQYRVKPYSMKAEKKNWTNIDFSGEARKIRGTININSQGAHAVEFRLIDNKNNILSVGLVEQVFVRSE